MNDAKYVELYDLLEKSVRETGRCDSDVLNDIFEGKIVAIVYKAYGECSDVLDGFTKSEDLCHDILLRLWEKTADMYFNNPKYVTSPVGYLKWCKAVTRNYIKTLIRKINTTGTKPIPEGKDIPADGGPGPMDIINREDVLLIYNTVASLRSKVEMKLAWYGVFNRIYTGYSKDKIRATRSFAEETCSKTLDEIFADQVDFFVNSEYSCMKISKSRLVEIKLALDKEEDDGRRLGDLTMGELLGKKPLSKISDWIYKINQKLLEMKEEGR